MANYVNNNSVKKENAKIVMGLDPSFSHTGICILKNNILENEREIILTKGVATKPDKFLEERIGIIVDEVLSLIKEYKVEHIHIEGLSYASNTSSVRQLAGLYYVLLYEFNKKKISFEVISPNSLKFKATGSGKARKDEMKQCLEDIEIELLSKTSKLKDTSKKFEDIIDAYLLASYNLL